MRAAYYEKNGAAREVLTRRRGRDPAPGPGEVRVKLATSGVNPSDVKARGGATRKIAFPRVIPHSDGAGEIDLVGDGVDRARVGERVWTWNGQWKRAFGTCAEYVVLPQAQAVRLPDHVSFEAGACLGIPAMTAYHAVAVAGADAGVTLLIAGGAGAVAHYAIQFAKARGANRDHQRELRREGEDRARRRRRPRHQLQARERRRAGDGDRRRGWRRCGDRARLRRQRQAPARCAAPAGHGGGLRHRRGRMRKFPRSSSWSMPSRSNSSSSTS